MNSVNGLTYKYCYIILHYQNIEDTLACIESIMALDNQQETGIVIIDNASPNGTGKELHDKYDSNDNVHVILNSSNDGFSHANNIAGKWAKENWNPDFYIVANNDIVFHENDFNNKIDKIYAEDSFSVLGPDIYDIHKGNHQNPQGLEAPSYNRISLTITLNKIALAIFPIAYPLLKVWFKRLDNNIQSVAHYNEKIYNPHFMGACLIFSRKYMDARNAFFEPETYFYSEEAILYDWCKKNKHTTVYTPELSVHHTGGMSTKSEKDLKKRMKFQMNNIIDSSKIYRTYLKKDNIII